MEDRDVYSPPESQLEKPETGPQLASRWSRFWGAMIDGLIGMAISMPVLIMVGYWDRAMAQQITPMETVMGAIFGFTMFIVVHGYFLSRDGQTIGKKLVGTRIVSAESNELLPLWKILFARYLPISVVANIPLAGTGLLIVNYLFIYRKDKRCLHDLVAGTKVIRAREPEPESA